MYTCSTEYTCIAVHRNLLTCIVYMYVHRPECLSHPDVPWDHIQMVFLGNVLIRISYLLVCIYLSVISRCTYMYETASRMSVPSPCTMGPHGIPWECTTMYYNIFSIYMYIQCPGCLSHPTVLWDHLGILGNVLICTVYMHVQCPECLSHPTVPYGTVGWDRHSGHCTCMGPFGNPWECTNMYIPPMYMYVHRPECLFYLAVQLRNPW